MYLPQSTLHHFKWILDDVVLNILSEKKTRNLIITDGMSLITNLFHQELLGPKQQKQQILEHTILRVYLSTHEHY